ncbi:MULTISPECIES: hypothetical protein [Vibrio]|uniref:hypothetical protein n=1 Tax=Vibrio TaxID=662 RepID=UPI0022CD8712|nr:hypothetical protein [Vibrio sp. Makdt]MDA0155959.1 hypothetical protein [Vibrio sp. Makdt]
MKFTKYYLLMLATSPVVAAENHSPPPMFTGSAEVFDSVANSVDPEAVCQTFNSLTTQANEWLQQNGYPDSTVSKDFCKAVTVETSYPTLKFNDIKDSESWGVAARWEYWLDEEVDVTEKVALVLLSESVADTKRARYMLYNLSDASLVKQYGQYNYDDNIGPEHDDHWGAYGQMFTQDDSSPGSDGVIMPTFWYRSTSGANILSNTWHNSSFRTFLIDRSDQELYEEVEEDAIQYLQAIGQPVNPSTIEQVLPHFYYQVCTTDGDADPRCLPGGESNTNNFYIPFMYPQSDSTSSYTHGTSSTVGMSLSAGGEISGEGPSAGFDISVSQEFSEEFSKEGQITSLDRNDLRNNFGAVWKYRIDPIILQGVKSEASLEESGEMEDRFTNANTVIGEESWKNIDLSNQVDWQETITSQNCPESSEREMWFMTTYDLARTALTVYDSQNSFSDIIETHEGGYTNNPQPISAISRGSIIKLDTICKEGFRQAKTGLLN